ncbi:MAG: hypothetical protein ACM3O7_03450 [Acidobacteriota bacterium]
MSASLPPWARSRVAQRTSEDLSTVRFSGTLIADLDTELDRLLLSERRPTERVRLLRETTNRITRAANDAVHAYRRASRTVRLELERPDADVEAATATRARLDQARRDVLAALEVAKRRYPAVDEMDRHSPVR